MEHARGLIAHLGTRDFVTAKDNVVFLGPPAPARPTDVDRLGCRCVTAAGR